MPKYCKSGDVCPGCVGTCWNLLMVCGVRRMPLGALAAILAASEYWPFPNELLNFLMKSSSAPLRLLRTANLSAMSGFCRFPLM